MSLTLTSPTPRRGRSLQRHRVVHTRVRGAHRTPEHRPHRPGLARACAQQVPARADRTDHDARLPGFGCAVCIAAACSEATTSRLAESSRHGRTRVHRHRRRARWLVPDETLWAHDGPAIDERTGSQPGPHSSVGRRDARDHLHQMGLGGFALVEQVWAVALAIQGRRS
jgi:hypothetical protein